MDQIFVYMVNRSNNARMEHAKGVSFAHMGNTKKDAMRKAACHGECWCDQ
jgi:hypothetical protein